MSLTQKSDFTCEKCHEKLTSCAKCQYKFELASEFMRCLDYGTLHFHFCNDDCLIDFVFDNYVSDSYAV
jgi:hypothetical protein